MFFEENLSDMDDCVEAAVNANAELALACGVRYEAKSCER
jgi:hypothetical protein